MYDRKLSLTGYVTLSVLSKECPDELVVYFDVSLESNDVSVLDESLGIVEG